MRQSGESPAVLYHSQLVIFVPVVGCGDEYLTDHRAILDVRAVIILVSPDPEQSMEAGVREETGGKERA